MDPQNSTRVLVKPSHDQDPIYLDMQSEACLNLFLDAIEMTRCLACMFTGL